MKERRGFLIFAALLAYSVLAQTPSSSVQDYYNQGNAHARAGEWGFAMLDYQRARLLTPNDPDLDANLRYVVSSAKLTVPPPRLLDRIVRMSSPDLATGVGLLGLVLLATSGLWRRIGLRAAAALLGAVLTGFTVCHALALRPLLNSAVVVRGPAPVQASPVPMAEALFSLAEAETVRIEGTRPDYLLVSTANGRTGWVGRSHVQAILIGP